MSEHLAEVIRHAIRAERVRAERSQADVAAVLGVSPAVMSAIETGRRAVLAAELPEICDALGVTLDRLLQDASADDLRRLGL